MRIISGTLRGKKLHKFSSIDIRPTSDRVRESLFSILGDRFRDRNVLDLFAGTGALGLEALSRGAARAVFVDNNVAAIGLIRRNIAGCRMEERTETVRWNILGNLNCLKSRKALFHIVFLDPPYSRKHIEPTLRHLVDSRCMAKGARLVVEHTQADGPPEALGEFSLHDRRRYGKTVVSIMRYMV